MKKSPQKIMAAAFAAVAVVELIVLLALIAFVGIDRLPWVVFFVLGMQILIFGGIGFGFFSHVRKRERIREELINGGRYEMAQIVAVEQKLNMQINGRHPYYVLCHIERDGVLHEYTSDLCYHRPALQVGDSVRVYLDWQDDANYFVDIEGSSPSVVRHG